jgi:deglycase
LQNHFTKNSILIFLPENNFNEEEYLTTKRIFSNGGKNVFITSDSNIVCKGENGLKVKADTDFNNVNEKNFSAVVLIGGKGSKDYWNNESMHRIVRKFKNAHKVVAAICSAPIILARAGLLLNISATCWSEDKNELINAGIDYMDRNVVVGKNIVTANGPKAAEQFAETILNLIK